MECKHRKGISRGEIDEKERNINLLFNNNNIFIFIYIIQPIIENHIKIITIVSILLVVGIYYAVKQIKS